MIFMKRILGKQNGQGLTQAIVTQDDGSIIEHYENLQIPFIT